MSSAALIRIKSGLCNSHHAIPSVSGLLYYILPSWSYNSQLPYALFFLQHGYFPFLFAIWPTCWLYYLVVISKCQIYCKKTFFIFTPPQPNDQHIKTINAIPTAQYYQTESYIEALTSPSYSLNDTFLLSYTTYYRK